MTFVLAALMSIQVMVLGVAHLEAKHDIYNSVFQDSPLSPKRQAQSAAVVERLARFRPTKVLIEAPFGNPVYAERYRKYLAGQFALPADEIYQFGFRLAARAGNTTIYPIDTFDPSLIDDATPSGKRIMAFLTAHFNDVRDPAFDAYNAHDDRIERSGTYLDVLRYLNTDAAIRANASWYSVMAGMGRDADYAGARYVAQWYARNSYIFSNIVSVVRPGDRVVVIMGQGHEYLLREFVRLNPNMTDVDPLGYL
jgi:Family of unknown function (DUF5694)